MQNNSSFISFNNQKEGLLKSEENHEKYPLNYYNVISGKGFVKKENSSVYGFVYEGRAFLSLSKEKINSTVSAGTYFSTSENFLFQGNFKAILIEVYHKKGEYTKTKFKAVNHIGTVEKEGRLKYIDGCTDSLLIPPVKLGDPCFNHLHFPENIDQTSHTHPSHRIGIVAKGNGLCKTPFGNIELKEGMIFIIKEWNGKSFSTGIDGNEYPDGTHSFQTFDEGMDVIAFHPDSDFGATDVDHPMINRTIVDGVSANKLENIRTK